MWVVTVFENKFVRFFECAEQGEAKLILNRYSKNARLSYVE